MAFTCPNCGYKSNEVKGGGAVPPKGTVHTLTARTQSDFSRDVLKVLSELSAQLSAAVCAYYMPLVAAVTAIGTVAIVSYMLCTASLASRSAVTVSSFSYCSYVNHVLHEWLSLSFRLQVCTCVAIAATAAIALTVPHSTATTTAYTALHHHIPLLLQHTPLPV
jgi:ZPR1 zinc-finger domain